MAEAISFGASILGIAAFGASVVITLRTFASSYSSADQKVRDLSADVALTVSILTELGNTIKEYEVEFGLRSNNFRGAKAACERNFERLQKALRKAKHEQLKEEEGKNTKDVKTSKEVAQKEQRMGAWDKLKFALGGENNLKNLLSSMETAKSNLQLLLDSLNLLILKKLNHKHLLSDEQAEDLGLLVQHLPVLLRSLQDAKLVKRAPEKPQMKEVPNVDLTTPSLCVCIEDAVKAVGHIPPKSPRDESLVAKDSAPSNESEVENDCQAKLEYRDTLPKGFGNESQNSSGSSQMTPDQRDSLGTRSFYEGWVLAHEKSIAEPKVAVFCGIKLKVYSDGYYIDKYSILPFSRDQATLKRHVEEFERGYAVSKDQPGVTELLRGLPKGAQAEVEDLLEDRNFQSRKPYGWKIAAIINTSKPKSAHKAFWKNRWGSEIAPQWLIVLRGGKIESTEKELEDLPNRFSNPWGEEHQLRPARLEMVVVDKRRDQRKDSGRIRSVDVFVIEEHGPPRRNKRQMEERRDEDQSEPEGEKKRLHMRKLSLSEDIELAAGATGAVVTSGPIIKALDSEDLQLEHALKAGVGAAVAIGAYELLQRREEDRESLPTRSKFPSPSTQQKDRRRHLTEEIVGAYSLGKELMGDKKHHVAHLVGEAIGATGLLQELRNQGDVVTDYSEETGKQDELLPQEEAERLMDEFLATFTNSNS